MALLADLARGGAAALAAAALAACYQPTVRDCSVSCASASDCAGDQVCGATGWCAAPDVACALEPDAANGDGASGDGDGGDGDADGSDAMTPIDATPMIDAGADLHIVISGRGSVAGDFPGVSCQVPPGDCTYGIPPGTMVTLTAVDGPGNHRFSDWSTPNCAGVGRTCVVTIAAPVTLVAATFE